MTQSASPVKPTFSSDSHPTVSIVINNFNYGRFLSDAIESALSQRSPADEVIVVDDGSTDDSLEVIRRYGDAVIPVLKSNGGQTSSFNHGFKRCRGDIVCFLDADDALEGTAIASLRQAFASPTVVKVHWPLTVIGADGTPTGKRKPSHQLQEGALLPRLLQLGPDDATWVPTSGNAWRRTFLERVLPLPEPERQVGVGSASADACLSMLAPLYGTVARIAEPQGKYRVHGANDHSCMDFEKRLNRDIALFEQRAALLVRHCNSHGVSPDPEVWRENAWCYKLKRALTVLDQVVPRSSPFLLLDDLSWQLPRSDLRKSIPFLEQNGQYAGPPSNSSHAIIELERMRSAGVQYIAVTWPSFWWFQFYPDFEQYLHRNYTELVHTSDLIVFNLAVDSTKPSTN